MQCRLYYQICFELTKEAFKEIFDQHFDSLRNYIFYRSGDTELSTDICQEVFLKIWEKNIENDKTKIKGLLFKIAGDLLVNQFRKKQTILKFRSAFEIQQEDNSPEEIMEFYELKIKYEKTIASLPENQRVVFLMSRNDGLKYNEIAEYLSISVKTVEKRMSKTLAIMKKTLNYYSFF